MCQIIHVTDGVIPANFKEMIFDSCLSNSDGAGIMYMTQDGEVEFRKFFSPNAKGHHHAKQLIEFIETELRPMQAQIKEFAIHTRFATKGAKSGSNVHPFQIPSSKSDKYYSGLLMHNGTFTSLGDAKNSDSSIFADLCRGKNLVEIEELRKLHSESSKLLVCRFDATHTFHRLGSWIQKDKIFFSSSMGYAPYMNSTYSRGVNYGESQYQINGAKPLSIPADCPLHLMKYFTNNGMYNRQEAVRKEKMRNGKERGPSSRKEETEDYLEDLILASEQSSDIRDQVFQEILRRIAGRIHSDDMYASDATLEFLKLMANFHWIHTSAIRENARELARMELSAEGKLAKDDSEWLKDSLALRSAEETDKIDKICDAIRGAPKPSEVVVVKDSASAAGNMTVVKQEVPGEEARTLYKAETGVESAEKKEPAQSGESFRDKTGSGEKANRESNSIVESQAAKEARKIAEEARGQVAVNLQQEGRANRPVESGIEGRDYDGHNFPDGYRE